MEEWNGLFRIIQLLVGQVQFLIPLVEQLFFVKSIFIDMKKQLLILICIGVSMGAFSQKTKVLFIGNSYTAVNDLPATFSQLSLSLGDSIMYDANYPGGYTFNLHSTNVTTLQKIAIPGWDYVVLQAQSQEPSFSPGQVATETYPYATKLDSLIHVTNVCARTMFYMTWGRKYGDASNCPFYPPVCTFAGMNDRLRASYLEMGADNFSRVSPVGVAWRNAWMADSSINLWSGDNSHPSVAGTYLTACVFYAAIFHQTPVGSTYTAGLTAPQATFLQNIAAQTVLDSLNTWMLNQDPIHADFTQTPTGSSMQFTANCYNATSFQWNFGDGVGTSNVENPSYTYGSNGIFPVQLIASNACFSDTFTVNITVGNAGMEDNNPTPDYTVFPNPANEVLYLSENATNQSFSLVDVHGRMVKQGIILPQGINTSEMEPGIYFLRVKNSVKKIIIE
jgi:PKD repeat protein